MASETLSFYASAARIQPRRASGRYARLRVLAMALLLGFYYLAPWIEIGGTPLVFLDLPHRRFHVFGMTLVPQDLWLLTWLLLIAALTLFFFTSMAGRLWCGYACPQTVWTEAFLWIEHFAEGDRHKRMKLDRSAWTGEKLLRRGGKHALWLLFGLYTGLTFVAYFIPARELFPAALTLQLSGWPLFWSAFYGFATWGNAGFMREQVCKYMCPYARFQSAMFDRDTLVISYDQRRGEPRKSVARKAGPAALLSGEIETPRPHAAGDCVDCSLCVQVCPMGIDIRNGLQYECIACAACVDACNGVMDSVDKPRGLIRYTSARQEAEGGKLRWLRPRALGYGALWLLLCAGFVTAVLLRSPLEFDVIRDRHSLYRELADGRIENLYTLKIANTGDHAHRFELEVTLPNGDEASVEPHEFDLGAGEARAIVVTVRIPREAATGPVVTTRFHLETEDAVHLNATRSASFLAGG